MNKRSFTKGTPSVGCPPRGGPAFAGAPALLLTVVFVFFTVPRAMDILRKLDLDPYLRASELTGFVGGHYLKKRGRRVPKIRGSDRFKASKNRRSSKATGPAQGYP